MNDTTAADPAVLLPLVDGQVTDCRKKNIRFVRVQPNLDFASLVTLDPPGVTVLHAEFYIKLPDIKQLSVRYEYLLWARPAKARC